MRKYYEEITFIRAVACLFVLMTHVTLMYPEDVMTVSLKVTMILNQFARVGTPVFCLISAFLLFNSFKEKKMDHRKFTISRTKKIVVPYLVWSMVYLVAMEISGKGSFEWHRIPGYLLLGDSYVHLYFIVIVLQFYLLFMLTHRFYSKRNIGWLSIASIVVMISWYLARDGHVLNHRAFILNWIGYFMMGGFMAYYYEEIQQLIKRYSKLILYYVVMGILCVMVEIDLPRLFRSDRMMNIYLVPVFVMLLIAVYPYLSIWARQLFEFIGNRAMGIYLVHMLVIGLLGEVISPTFWNPSMILFNYISVVVVTLITVELLRQLPYSEYLFPVAARPGTNAQPLSLITRIKKYVNE